MREFLKQYEWYVQEVLEPTYEEMKQLFNVWQQPSYWRKYAAKSRVPIPSFIQKSDQRIKRPESMVNKILRNPMTFPEGLSKKSFRKLNDAVAGRVVVYFLSNLPLIDREIQHHENLEISPTEKPVAYLSKDLISRLGLTHLHLEQKDSGYASIHYVVRFRESLVAAEQRPWFEIQLLTLVENVWGEIEHVLGYKPGKRTSFAVRKQFQIIATQLQAIDEHFNFLYTELSRFQERASYEEATPLNAENLPAVLNEIGLECAQKEIDDLLKILASREIATVGGLLAEASTNRIETIRHTFIGHDGRPPSDFEIMTSIAAVKGIRDENTIVETIRARIGFLNAWQKLKDNF